MSPANMSFNTLYDALKNASAFDKDENKNFKLAKYGINDNGDLVKYTHGRGSRGRGTPDRVRFVETLRDHNILKSDENELSFDEFKKRFDKKIDERKVVEKPGILKRMFGGWGRKAPDTSNQKQGVAMPSPPPSDDDSSDWVIVTKDELPVGATAATTASNLKDGWPSLNLTICMHKDGMQGAAKEFYGEEPFSMVNAANKNMRHGSGIAKKISDDAGPAFDQYTKNNNKSVKVGDCLLSGPFGYKDKSGFQNCTAIHNVVAPKKSEYSKTNQEQYDNLFKKTIVSLMKSAYEDSRKRKASKEPVVSCLVGCAIFGGSGKGLAKATYAALTDPEVKNLKPAPPLHFVGWDNVQSDDAQVVAEFISEMNKLVAKKAEHDPQTTGSKEEKKATTAQKISSRTLVSPPVSPPVSTPSSTPSSTPFSTPSGSPDTTYFEENINIINEMDETVEQVKEERKPGNLMIIDNSTDKIISGDFSKKQEKTRKDAAEKSVNMGSKNNQREDVPESRQIPSQPVRPTSKKSKKESDYIQLEGNDVTPTLTLTDGKQPQANTIREINNLISQKKMTLVKSIPVKDKDAVEPVDLEKLTKYKIGTLLSHTVENDVPIYLSVNTIEGVLNANNNCFICPITKKRFGVETGNQPPGKIKIEEKKYDLAGFDKNTGTIEITYEIFEGTQKDNHPNPGINFDKIKRTAYLPNNEEGRKVARLLKVAFNRRLIFTVGRSVTSMKDNVVTWNGIHHKTNNQANQSFGYPDKTYLERVTEELREKGVTEKDIEGDSSLLWGEEIVGETSATSVTKPSPIKINESSPYAILMNSEEIKITDDNGEEWTSANRLFHAMKFPGNKDIQKKIKDAKDDEKARQIANSNLNKDPALRRQWTQGGRMEAMEKVLRMKLEQNNSVRGALKELKNKEIIIEGHPPWGMPRSGQTGNNEVNLLGKIWMELAKEIK